MSIEFETAIAQVRARDPRYARDVYVFIFEALNFTQRRLGRQHHVTGQELLDGIRALAQQQFGYLAKTVFNEWGVYATADFGHVVFNLVDANLMGRQDSDALDDFADRYDFAAAFEDGFQLDTPQAVGSDADPDPDASEVV